MEVFKMATHNLISTSAKRERLKPSREPYWFKLAPKRYVGYRRLTSSGSWLGRYGSKRKVIGNNSLSFDEALKLTIQFCDQHDATIPINHTVQSIITIYCDDLIIRKSFEISEKYRKRYNAMLPVEFRSTDILSLTTEQIEKSAIPAQIEKPDSIGLLASS